MKVNTQMSPVFYSDMTYLYITGLLSTFAFHFYHFCFQLHIFHVRDTFIAYITKSCKYKCFNIRLNMNSTAHILPPPKTLCSPA